MQTLSPPVDIRDPLDVLLDAIGHPSDKHPVTERPLEEGRSQEKSSEAEANINFGGLSLQKFAEPHHERTNDLQSIGPNNYVQNVVDCS